MSNFLETVIARFWNRRVSRATRIRANHGLDVGARLANGEPASGRVTIPDSRRAQHISLIGKSGYGKSSELKAFAQQSIRENRGFVFTDLHGDATDFLVAAIAEHERTVKQDLSDRLIVIEPAHTETSVGVNLIEAAGMDRFVAIGEFAEILKRRWHLESFGPRTHELLSSALHVLSESGLTLVELAPLLSHAAFRAACLKNVKNAEIKQYFELRYNQLSEAMQRVMAEPILNKTSTFTANPRFRSIIGQQHSTFSLVDALDRACWILLDLHKGKLGEQALTLNSIFFMLIKHAIFARKSRTLFSLYCDEAQNLTAYDSGIETVLSESRKFACSVISANQFLDQLPSETQSAILSVGTQIFFQLSSADAQKIATALDGGKPLAELLRNLPPRHMVVKSGHERWQEAVAPTLREPKIDPSDLLARSRARWARNREDIEEEIRRRQAIIGGASKEALHDWE